MKKQVYAIVAMALACIMLTTVGSFAQGSEKEQRIKASYMIAFGRLPSGGELNYWNGQGNYSVQQLVENHKRYLGSDAATKKSVITKSYNDAFGRNPNSGEMAHWSKYSQTYTELMNAHVQWLGSNSGEYVEVIKRSYNKVFGRQPNSGEINFWKNTPYSYVILLACHDNYKRTNGSSGTSKISTSTKALNTVSLSNAVANEAKAAAGIRVGGNVIAVGGGNVISAGGGNVIAAGGGNVISAGGLN